MDKHYFRKKDSCFNFASVEYDSTTNKIGEMVVIREGQPPLVYDKRDREGYSVLCDIVLALFEPLCQASAQKAGLKMKELSSWEEVKELEPNQLTQIEIAINDKKS